jgi:putative SOS response-associated peptidase YedK
MCGRFVIAKEQEEIAELFEIEVTDRKSVV